MNQCVPVLPPPATLPPSDPCDGVTCRGSQVCNNGVCERPSRTSSGSSSGSSDGGCSSDSDCRGSQVCNSGSCERMSSGSSGSTGSSGSSGRTSGTRGGGRGGIKTAKTMESLAFDGGLETESKSGISLHFKSFDALMSMTVNVSTLLMFAVVAIAVWFGVSCFRNVDGQKKERKHDGEMSYGAV